MTIRELKVAVLALSCLALLAFLPGFSCSKPLISDVAFSVEPNLETLKIALNFSKDVQTDLGGSFDVKNYGAIEVEPTTPTTPFNVGFRLNLGIVNDQDYVRLTPVTTLPSGQPLPFNVNRAMAQVKLVNQINPNFDVYAYVDIVGKEWLGVAVTLKFINNKYFPAGLSVSKQFLKNSQGLARAAGSVFGPKVDSNGQLLIPGGIALFANAKAIIQDAKGSGQLEGTDKGSKLMLFNGLQAPYYEKHPRAAFQLQQAFKELLRANSYGNTLM